MSTDLGVYELVRYEDVSGVSGTGPVAEVAVFSDGTAVLHWEGEKHTTTTVHVDGLESILDIHGHNGKTVLRRIDGESGRPAGVGEGSPRQDGDAADPGV